VISQRPLPFIRNRKNLGLGKNGRLYYDQQPHWERKDATALLSIPRCQRTVP